MGRGAGEQSHCRSIDPGSGCSTPHRGIHRRAVAQRHVSTQSGCRNEAGGRRPVGGDRKRRPALRLPNARRSAGRLLSFVDAKRPHPGGWLSAKAGRDFIGSVHPEMKMFVQGQGLRKKITAGIWLIFRGLFFEQNAGIGQKGHFWRDTRQGPTGAGCGPGHQKMSFFCQKQNEKACSFPPDRVKKINLAMYH